LGEVETFGFLGGGFGVCAFGRGACGFLFFGEEGVFFGLFAGRFCFLGFCFFSDVDVSGLSGGDVWAWGEGDGDDGMYFLAFDFAPLLHSRSSSDAFFEFSAAAFCAATSAFFCILGQRTWRCQTTGTGACLCIARSFLRILAAYFLWHDGILGVFLSWYVVLISVQELPKTRILNLTIGLSRNVGCPATKPTLSPMSRTLWTADIQLTCM